MKVSEFVEIIDNKKTLQHDVGYPAAYNWADERNKNLSCVGRWSWDCGFKLDYDGSIFSISSRFYPPYRQNVGELFWNGTVSIIKGNDCIHEKKFKEYGLNLLAEKVENYVNIILGRIEKLIITNQKEIFET